MVGTGWIEWSRNTMATYLTGLSHGLGIWSGGRQGVLLSMRQVTLQ